MEVQPYLFFDGRAEEAIDFYRSKLGAKVDFLMRFKESPDPQTQQCIAQAVGCGRNIIFEAEVLDMDVAAGVELAAATASPGHPRTGTS